MVTKYYEVDIKFKETGKGQAEIVVPKVLKDREWHYVQVHEGEQKAIIRVEAVTKEHEAITADEACRLLTDKRLSTLKESYPAPRLKQAYRPLEVGAGLSPEEIKRERTLETFQQVRWKFYVIDVPVRPE